MKIQLGQILMNKTKKYLLPCLKSYGENFEKRFSKVWKVAIGIGDMVTVKSNISLEKHVFLLCESSRDPNSFISFLDWIKEQEDIYEEDYAYDNIDNGCLHMIVIKVPEQYYPALETFKRSEFSSMYSKDDLLRFFNQNSEVLKVLIKDHNYKFQFSKIIKEEFDVELPVEEIDESFELDLPIMEFDEIFNTHLK